jgi:voltage-gated potassium channel
MEPDPAGGGVRSGFSDLGRGDRWGILIASVARTVVVLAVILVSYFLLPVSGFNEASPLGAWLRLAALVLVFLTAMVLQARLIIGAAVPQARAVESVVELVMVFICLFALLYLALSGADPAAFSQPLSRLDALYFATSTLATVGFGDITARSQLARGVVTVQMLADLGVLVLIAKVTFFAARRGAFRLRRL